MASFNLLSDNHKTAVRWELYSRILFSASFFVALWVVIFSVALFSAHRYLFIQEGALHERIEQLEATKETQEARDLENKIGELNDLLFSFEDIRKEQGYDIPLILEELAPLVPAGSSLEQLTFSSNVGIITLRGNAALRSQVISLQKSLEEHPDFVAIEAPLTNLLKAEDVDFSFTIRLKEEEKKKNRRE